MNQRLRDSTLWWTPVYRDPRTLSPEQVCPHCKRKTVEYRFLMDGQPILTHHCPEHRDVIPIRSVILRDDFAGEIGASGN